MIKNDKENVALAQALATALATALALALEMKKK